MLVFLLSNVHADIMTITQQFKSEVSAVTKRVLHIKSKMGEFTATFNEMVDAHNDRDDKLLQIKSKLAGLVNRSR